MEIIKIENKEIELKEWNGQRVVTAWDIASVHNKDVKVIIQQFKRNKNNLILGTDYYLVDKEILKSQFVTLGHTPNLSSEIPLFTLTGYLMLSKTFRDNISWNMQRVLVNTYFSTRELARVQSELIRKKQRELGKKARKRETDSIKLLIGYIRENNGSIYNESYIYSNYTRLGNKAFKELLGYGKGCKVDRELLSDYELVELSEIEKIIDNEMIKSIVKRESYKDIYQRCNEAVNEYVAGRKAVLSAIKTVRDNTGKEGIFLS